MPLPTDASFSAFAGSTLLASGDLAQATEAALQHLAQQPMMEVLVFDNSTGKVVDIDPPGQPGFPPVSAPAFQPEPPQERRVGRPRLGVVAREVTLLPRHWDWLAEQPGGASVALRKLVEAARRTGTDSPDPRRAREVAFRFLQTLAGNEVGFEEACRALFAGDGPRLEQLTRTWPTDVRTHGLALAEAGLVKG